MLQQQVSRLQHHPNQSLPAVRHANPTRPLKTPHTIAQCSAKPTQEPSSSTQSTKDTASEPIDADVSAASSGPRFRRSRAKQSAGDKPKEEYVADPLLIEVNRVKEEEEIAEEEARGTLDDVSFSEMDDKLYFLEPETAQEGIDVADELATRKRYKQAIEMYCFARTLEGQGPQRTTYSKCQLSDRQKAQLEYNIACCYSIVGETDKSVESLRELMKMGFGSFEDLLQDPDLDVVRRTPEFFELMKQYVPQGYKKVLNYFRLDQFYSL